MLGALLAGYWVLAAVGAAGILLLFWVYARMRVRHRVHACDGCPELGTRAVCSGYALQAEHVRACEDEMTERLAPDLARELLARDASTR